MKSGLSQQVIVASSRIPQEYPEWVAIAVKLPSRGLFREVSLVPQHTADWSGRIPHVL